VIGGAEIAGLDIAGLDIVGPVWQGWTLADGVARVDIGGLDNGGQGVSQNYETCLA